MPFYSIRHLSFLLFTHLTITHALTLPILPLNITALNQNLTTSLVDPPNFRGHCVDHSLFPGWDGAIDNYDCLGAQYELELRVKHSLKKSYTFWSKTSTTTAPPDGWELPLMVQHSLYQSFPLYTFCHTKTDQLETCILLLQITKDLGNESVPFYQGRYLPTKRLATTVKSSWEVVLGAVTAVRQQCLKPRGQPGWADMAGGGGAKASIVLTLPAGSEMARKWAVGLGWGGGGWVGGTTV